MNETYEHHVDETATITWNVDAPANTAVRVDSTDSYVPLKPVESLKKPKPVLKYLTRNIGPNRAERRAHARQQRREA